MKIIFKILIACIVLYNSKIYCQAFTDQGVGSGSSIILLPTGSVAPSGNFRLQFHHFSFFRKHSLNSIDITTGLSSHMEFYIKYATELNQKFMPATITGFGGKFQFPFEIPYIYRSAIWAEYVNSAAFEKFVLFPSDLIRFGIVTSIYTNAIEPTLFMGMNRFNSNIRFLGSLGSTYSVSPNVKLGLEFTYGYFGNHDFTSLVSITYRILSNLSTQITGGYILATSLKSYTISAGLSLTTGAIDFSPRRDVEVKQIVPSFDDIMKSIEENGEAEKQKEQEK